MLCGNGHTLDIIVNSRACKQELHTSEGTITVG